MNLLAVYGTLREGNGNHVCLIGSPKVDTIRIDGWDMVSLGGFPAIDKGDGSVTVELYDASDEAERRCDMLEGWRADDPDNSFYHKTEIDTPHGKASVYYIPNVKEEGYEPIESGDWNYFRQARVVNG